MSQTVSSSSVSAYSFVSFFLPYQRGCLMELNVGKKMQIFVLTSKALSLESQYRQTYICERERERLESCDLTTLRDSFDRGSKPLSRDEPKSVYALD